MIEESTLKKGRILVVDDEEANVRLLERMLRRAEYPNVRTTTDPHEVVAVFDEFGPDLVLLDLHMPGLDGFDVMEQLQQTLSEEVFLPILVLTGDNSVEVKRRALLRGAKDFLTKPVDHFELLLRIWNLLEMRFLYRALSTRTESVAAS